MHNVVATNDVVKVPLGEKVLEKLGLNASYRERDLVGAIWFQFYYMIAILKKDPLPELLEGKPEGSLHANDYKWGYSTEDITLYKQHAEAFYQLFVLRYTAKELTPYMIKLVDYGCTMRNLCLFP